MCCIHTMKEEDIPRLTLTADKCVGATFALYGPTKSGKTIYTKYIMNLINTPLINQGIVISPTEPSNKEYQGCFPPPAIWHRIRAPEGAVLGKKSPTSPEGKMMFLRSIIDRQTMATSLYKDHNAVEKLEVLTQKLPPAGRDSMAEALKDLDKRTREAVRNIRNNPAITPYKKHEIVKQYTTLFDEMKGKIYKMYLNQNMDYMWTRAGLSQEEKTTLYYMNTNPNMLTVWDDCAASIKPLFKKEEFREMFYQPRHFSLTNIFTFQDNTDLDKNLRKQPFFSILCNAEVARGFCECAGFGKEEKTRALAMIPIIFAREFQKMVYVRDDQFYRISIEKTKPFRFGSDAFWEICDNVKSEENQLDVNNPYYKRFNVTF